MPRNPDAFTGEEYAARLVEEEVEEKDRCNVREAIRLLYARACKVCGHVHMDRLSRHLLTWHSRGVPIDESPFAKFIELREQEGGVTATEAAKRLAPAYGLSERTLRSQLSRIIARPQTKQPDTRKVSNVERIRSAIRASRHDISQSTHIQVTPGGAMLSVSTAGGTVRVEMTDDDVRSLMAWLEEVWG